MQYLVLAAALCLPLGGQPQPPPAAGVAQPWAPVTVEGRVLFSVQGALSFSAATRAAAISGRIEELARDRSFKPGTLTLAAAEHNTDIRAGDLVVMSITDQDARAASTTRQDLARDCMERIRAALVRLQKEYSLKSLSLGALYTVLATAGLFLFLRLLAFFLPRIYTTLDSWRGSKIRSLRIQKLELVPAGRIADSLIGLVKLVRLVVVVLAFYVYTSLILGFFPWTRSYEEVLLSYVMSPVKVVGHAALAYLPNLFFIAVILAVSFYVTKFIRLIFTELGRGTIAFPGFYPEWHEPTYKIARFMVIVLTVIVTFPYLPGARSPAFQGISIFLGVLFSLGST
ncbi:MAG: mechanosensitive ion channel family protein, partial [bacterium]